MKAKIRKTVKLILKEFGLSRSSFTVFGPWWAKHGFTKQTIELNGINKENYPSFLDNRRYRQGHPYNGIYSSIIDNKLYLPYLLREYSQYVPEYYFYINSGRIGSIKKGIENGLSSFLKLLADKRKLAIKQCYSSFGKGFYVVESVESMPCNNAVRVNGKVISLDEFVEILKGLVDYVCTEYVQQAEYSMAVCSTSLNTIRFLCVREEDDAPFSVVRCFHRFGVEGGFVDNLGAGNAYLFLLDVETGLVKGNGMKNEQGQGEVYVEDLEYPNGKMKKGMTIPRFKEVKEKVLEISNSFPFLRYIGWDVAITEDGFKIIEANSLTSLGILQRDGAFLEDEKLRKFFIGS